MNVASSQKEQTRNQNQQVTTPSNKSSSSLTSVGALLPPPPPSSKPNDNIQMDPNEIARRQAAARAYALSQNTSSSMSTLNSGKSDPSYSSAGGVIGCASTKDNSLNDAIIRRPAVAAAAVQGMPMRQNHTIMQSHGIPNSNHFVNNKSHNNPADIPTHTNPNANASPTSIQKITKNKAVRKLIPSSSTSSTSSTPSTSNNINTTSTTLTNVNVHSMVKKQYHQQIQHAHQMKFIQGLKMNNIDDEDYLNFVQGLWYNDSDSGATNTRNGNGGKEGNNGQSGSGINTNSSRTGEHEGNNKNYNAGGAIIHDNTAMTTNTAANTNTTATNTILSTALPQFITDTSNTDRNYNNQIITNGNHENNNNNNSNNNNQIMLDNDDDDDDDDEEYEDQQDGDYDDEEEDDDDDESSKNNNNIREKSKASQTSSTISSLSSPTATSAEATQQQCLQSSSHITINHNNQNLLDELDDFSIDYDALEEELGSLLEEDMEAAVSSLLNNQHENLDDQNNINHHYNHNVSGYIEGGVMNNISNSNMLLNSPLRTLPQEYTPVIKNSGNNNNNATPAGMSTPLVHSGAAGGPIIVSGTRTAPSIDRSPLAAGKNIRTSSSSTTSTPKSKGISSIAPTSSQIESKSVSDKSSSATAAGIQQHQQHPAPTEEQIQKLQKLMRDHYQVLLQQAVLAVRCAHGSKFNKDLVLNGAGSGHHLLQQQRSKKRNYEFFFCGETSDDLSMILDGAVTMLQDLDENRKDAMRNLILMSNHRHKMMMINRRKRRRVGIDVVGCNNSIGVHESNCVGELDDDAGNGFEDSDTEDTGRPRRLTRSVFSRTLQEHEWGTGGDKYNKYSMGGLNNGNMSSLQDSTTNAKSHDSSVITDGAGSGSGMVSNSSLELGAFTTFGVNGLSRLRGTFEAIDNSLNPSGLGGVNVFDEADHGHACEVLLLHARADFDRDLIPGYQDLSNFLTFPAEVLGSPADAVVKVKEPISMSPEQQTALRKNRGQFTASEDNLLLRGVNLYGEKEWTLISDRYLPDRSVSSISQRYWRLCLLIYMGQGIVIDQKGDLQTPPAHPGGANDFDEELIARVLKPVAKPIEYGLYRWSLEEDIMLLKALPIMGRMFSEIVKRFIPHRDRGALRKRYQVLERRVKGAMKRDKKSSNEIVRKKVAPLMEAISKKGPLPLPVVKQPATTQHLRRYMNVKPVMPAGKQVRMPMPTLPTASNVVQTRQPYLTLPSAVSSAPMNTGPTMNASVNTTPQVPNYNLTNVMPHPFTANNTITDRKQSSTNVPDTPGAMSHVYSNLTRPFSLESPSKIDSTSRIGFEKIMNGEYSQMSAVKHFMDENEDRTKDRTNPHQLSQQNQSSGHVNYGEASLPNFSIENTYSNLSLLSAVDVGASRSDNNIKNNNADQGGSSILKSVLGRTKDSRATPPPTQSSIKPPLLTPITDKLLGERDHQPSQSLDGFSFSNLRLPMDEDSRQVMEKDVGIAINHNPRAPPLPPLTNSYLGTPTAFSHFPNAQASNFFYNMTNNSLIVPPQHEVDAAATLSQMSNSSANFPNDLLQSPLSPDRHLHNRPLLPESKPRAANQSTGTATSSRPSLFDNVKGRTKNK